MIYTITLNPAIDYEIDLNEINLGLSNNIDQQRFIPGGKGINVSRGLSYLGINSKAIGFLGGFTGDFMRDKLKMDNFISEFVAIQDITRINLKIHEEHQHTEISGKSPRISSAEIEEFMKTLDNLKDDDILIISGSQPRVPMNIYQAILERYAHLNLQIILDVPGSAYRELLSYRPMLIKPNMDELKDFSQKKIISEDDIIQACKTMIEKGSRGVILSMGENGAFYVDHGCIYYAKPIKGNPRRLFGAGDHLIAGFVFGHLKGLNTKDKLRYGIACASLQIFEQNGYNQTKVEELMKLVEIEEITYD
ncbi:MAG: 1-phosphofructokinase family hexose kinase [Acholeplasmataceae bacterium]|nr:1-phosphofructokinase family hexose kinase [Acholeplasmataceae bacterium]